MQQDDLNKFNIKLKTIEDFFIEPVYDPFDPENRSQSGIDELVDRVHELSIKIPLHINLSLSSPPVDGAIEGITKNALKRYCSMKIRECELEIFKLRSQGKRDLVWALGLSFIFFLGAFFASQLPFLPDFVIFLLSTGFGILAWVVLWPPLDNLLYEWRPCRQSQRIYKYIQSAELVINFTQPE